MAVTDFDDLCILYGDPVFTRPVFGDPMSAEDVWLRLLRDLGHWQAVGYGNWAVRLRDDGDFVGSVGVLNYRRALDPPFDAPELGWGLSPRHQGRGHAMAAVSAVLDWVDIVLNVPRTVCMIDPENAPSLRLAARVGFAPYADGLYKAKTLTLLERHRSAKTET